MNLIELKEKIGVNTEIPRDSYSLDGGLPNEVFCLDYSKGQWSIYYSERGSKSDLKKFNDESKACEYFYESLLKMLGIQAN